MGIRFNCSHCQKRLNVKSNQAGQAGLCPACHHEIVVPQDSRDSLSTNSVDTQDQESRLILAIDNQVTLASLSDSSEAGSEHRPIGSADFLDRPIRPLQKATPHQTEDSSSYFLLDKPQASGSLGKVDPIAEAPDRVWYFRDRQLREVGPLKAKQMQQHVEEGAVTIGCAVWREDWDQWQMAEKSFPVLVALAEKKMAQRLQSDARKGAKGKAVVKALSRPPRWLVGLLASAAGLLIIGGLVYLLINLMSAK